VNLTSLADRVDSDPLRSPLAGQGQQRLDGAGVYRSIRISLYIPS